MFHFLYYFVFLSFYSEGDSQCLSASCYALNKKVTSRKTVKVEKVEKEVKSKHIMRNLSYMCTPEEAQGNENVVESFVFFQKNFLNFDNYFLPICLCQYYLKTSCYAMAV